MSILWSSHDTIMVSILPREDTRGEKMKWLLLIVVFTCIVGHVYAFSPTPTDKTPLLIGDDSNAIAYVKQELSFVPSEYLQHTNRIYVYKYPSPTYGCAFSFYAQRMIIINSHCVQSSDEGWSRYMIYHELGHLFAQRTGLNRGTSYDEREFIADSVARDISNATGRTIDVFD